MAKQHDLIVNRMLANYLMREFELDEAGRLCGNDINAICGMHRLHEEDVKAIISASKKRLKQLEKSSAPLGEKVVNWVTELENA